MKVLLCILCAVVLAGCAGSQHTLPRLVRVEVPVMVPCPVVAPHVTPYATARLTRESTDFDKIKALLVERKERAGTESELRELLGVCSKP